MARKTTSLAGQSILVTGAARGIGAEAARRMAARKALLTLAGLEPELLERSARDCGPEAEWVEADVSDPVAVEEAVRTAVSRFGGLDMVVANAAIGAMGTVRTMPASAWERVVEVNLLGTYRTVRACLPHLIDRGGHVLIVGSVSALVHEMAGLSAYVASKAATEAFADTLRVEVAHLGVTVGVAYFPWVDTDMVREGDKASPALRELRASAKGPLAKTQPVSAVAEALVKGAERRDTRVVAPRLVGPLLLMRGFLGRLAERDGYKTAPGIVRAAESESTDRGAEAFAPLGPGGVAAMKAAQQPADDLSVRR